MKPVLFIRRAAPSMISPVFLLPNMKDEPAEFSRAATRKVGRHVHGYFGRELVQVKLQDIDASMARGRRVREAEGSLNHPRPKVSFSLGGRVVRIALGVVRLIDAESNRLPGSRAASGIRSREPTPISPPGRTGSSASGST